MNSKITLIITLLLLTAGCQSDYTSKSLLLESRVTPLDISETGFWVAKKGTSTQEKKEQPNIKVLLKECKEKKVTSEGWFKRHPCDDYVLEEVVRYIVQQLHKKLTEQKSFIPFTEDEILKLIPNEIIIEPTSQYLLLGNSHDNKLTEDDIELKLEKLANKILSLANEQYTSNALKKINQLGSVNDYLLENPHGELIQYKGNKTYSVQKLGKNTSHTIQVFEHPISGMMTKYYIAFYHYYGEYRYFFISKHRFGDWYYWEKDEAMAESLWQQREFNSKQALIKFSQDVFNGLGFIKKPLFIKAMPREDLLYLKKLAKILKEPSQ